jgi:hypothetical protein
MPQLRRLMKNITFQNSAVLVWRKARPSSPFSLTGDGLGVDIGDDYRLVSLR